MFAGIAVPVLAVISAASKSRYYAIFVRRPDAVIKTRLKAGTSTLLSAKTKRAVEQSINEPLESNRHLIELAAKLRSNFDRSSTLLTRVLPIAAF
jgi:hypothetical protein